VTGSTDGIGKAYALELASRGVNIVLISRTQRKLDEVAAEIESKFKVKTKTIAADFSKGPPVFDVIEEELRDIPVGILVNNVGRQYSYPMYLGEVPQQELWDILNINIGATTMMTRLVLPQMQKRKRGAIVNVSSGSELQPLPLMTVYAASKVFVKSFSDALRYEYQRDGITIQHLSPLFVNTKMNAFSHRLQETSLFVPDAATYSHNAVNTLGKVHTTTGYWAHGLQNYNTQSLSLRDSSEVAAAAADNTQMQYHVNQCNNYALNESGVVPSSIRSWIHSRKFPDTLLVITVLYISVYPAWKQLS
ncbi:hypothetical protein Cfor_05164, partial [Coptotermes formosanus]